MLRRICHHSSHPKDLGFIDSYGGFTSPFLSIHPNVGLLCWFVELCVVKHASDVSAGNFGALPKKKCSAPSIACAAFILAASAFHSMRFILFPN